MAELENLNKNLHNLNNKLDDLDTYLTSLANYGNIDKLEKQIAPLDSAKVNTALAYSLNSLYFVYMKANGIEKEDHKIN